MAVFMLLFLVRRWDWTRKRKRRMRKMWQGLYNAVEIEADVIVCGFCEMTQLILMMSFIVLFLGNEIHVFNVQA